MKFWAGSVSLFPFFYHEPASNVLLLYFPFDWAALTNLVALANCECNAMPFQVGVCSENNVGARIVQRQVL